MTADEWVHVLRVEVSITVAAPRATVVGVDTDFASRPRLFPTIRDNRFRSVAGGTRWTVCGHIRLKGGEAAAAVHRRYARRRIMELQLEPVKVAVERSVGR